ncbi:MAG: hypothetical protein LBU94_05050, partial [Clostridiales bacterium]|nr:hypothetical protein [Clostridiales bacterium]
MIHIDPATLRLILAALQRVVEDEEARKRIGYIIAVPIVLIVLLVTMIIHIFSLSPEEMLAEFGDDATVHEFIEENGYGFGYAGAEDIDWSLMSADSIDPELFDKLMNEATKYIGYPYVWVGSNPITSFDCSG